MVRKLNRLHGVKRSGMELRCMVWSEEVWYEVKRSGIKVEYTNIVS